MPFPKGQFQQHTSVTSQCGQLLLNCKLKLFIILINRIEYLSKPSTQRFIRKIKKNQNIKLTLALRLYIFNTPNLFSSLKFDSMCSYLPDHYVFFCHAKSASAGRKGQFNVFFKYNSSTCLWSDGKEKHVKITYQQFSTSKPFRSKHTNTHLPHPINAFHFLFV